MSEECKCEPFNVNTATSITDEEVRDMVGYNVRTTDQVKKRKFGAFRY